jgi:hypothetical protein
MSRAVVKAQVCQADEEVSALDVVDEDVDGRLIFGNSVVILRDISPTLDSNSSVASLKVSDHSNLLG